MYEQPALIAPESAESIVARADAEAGPFNARVALFSGGNDSTVLAHAMRDQYDELVHVDTGTAVEDANGRNLVRAFAEGFAGWLGKPLRVYEAPPGTWERLVVGGWDERRGRDVQALGFLGPMQHTRAYVELKERALDQMRGELKGSDRRGRVLALTGVRRGESQRRRARAEITRRGSLVFCNPLTHWTNAEMARYRATHRLPQSDVAAILHRSGECNCGAYATPEEREELRAWFPEWFERKIAPVERRAEALGLPVTRWGSGRDLLNARAAEAAGELCSDCQLRFESVGAPDGV